MTEGRRQHHQHLMRAVFLAAVACHGRTALVVADVLPVIQMHGMGDFAKNPSGMLPLARDISRTLGGVHVTNIQIGETPSQDSMNSYLMDMNTQVDYFAKAVRGDKELAEGFNAIGYSQGNLIIRAYIQKYNDPPVRRFLSMHGPMMGVAGLPGCNMTRMVCDEVDRLMALGAYTHVVQQHLAQANYLRDPLKLDKYRRSNVFLPDLNNEKLAGVYSRMRNTTHSSRLSSLDLLVLVMALDDTTVVPKESEWFGYFQDGSEKDVWGMREAPWYTEDWFGLRELDAQGKVVLEGTPGDHLRFAEEDLLAFVTKYLT